MSMQFAVVSSSTFSAISLIDVSLAFLSIISVSRVMKRIFSPVLTPSFFRISFGITIWPFDETFAMSSSCSFILSYFSYK